MLREWPISTQWCSISLAIREVQIKITMTSYFICNKIERLTITIVDVEQLEPHAFSDGVYNGTMTGKTVWEFLIKTKHISAPFPSNSSKYLPKRNENMSTKRLLWDCQSSFIHIHNSRKLETPQNSIHRE